MRLLAASLLALAACTTTVLEAGNYDRACTQDADCVAAAMGDQCQPCLCPNAGIRKDAKPIFDSDAAIAREACGPVPAVSCAPCPSRTGACRSGTCAAASP